jgi:hypothetical protein
MLVPGSTLERCFLPIVSGHTGLYQVLFNLTMFEPCERMEWTEKDICICVYYPSRSRGILLP